MLVKELKQDTHWPEIIVLGMGTIINTFFR